MDDRCAVCGQELTDGPHDHGVLLGDHGPAGRIDRGTDRDGAVRRWVLIGAAVVMAWVVVVVVGQLAAPDEVVQPPPPTPTPEPTATVAPAPTPLPTAVPTPELEVPAEDVDGAQLGSRQGADVQVERLVRQLDRRGSEAILAYRAAEGVVLVDLSAGTAEVVEPTNDAVFAPQYVVLRTGGDVQAIELSPDDVLLRSNGETFAIDRRDLRVRVISRDGSLVVSQSRGGSMQWVPGQDLQGSAPEVISLDAGSAEWFRAPQTVQLAAVDGLGLVGVSTTPSGGTIVAGRSDFEPLSEFAVLDGNAVGMLEARCVDSAACVLQVTPVEGEPWLLPPGFVELGDRFVLAPDARAVLRYTPQGFAEVYDVDARSAAWVTGASMNDAAWGPDSSFVAWVDVLGAPELRVMFVDQRDWLSINLAELGVPRPIDSEVVVFAQPPDGDEPGAS